MIRFCGMLCLILAMATGLAAQDFNGTLNGRVADTSGAMIPGVTVTIQSPNLQGTRTLPSDETGSYRFNLLPSGTYAVTFELPGFKKLVREGILVTIGKTTTVNVGLEVSAVAETVTVTGESPVVDVQNATVGMTISQSMLTNLPNARDLWVVLASTPGITTTRFDVGGSTMGTTTNFRSYGLDGQQWVNLDGVVTTGVYFNYGALQELQVTAASNSAEVPVPGAFVNMVMKSGGNSIHGDVYQDYEGSSFQSSNITQKLRDQGITEGDKFTHYNDLNVNVGGPFVQNKFWWFVSVRHQFSGQKTELKQNDGTPGAVFTTRLRPIALKLNYQLNPANAIVFTGHFSRKLQPFRGGQGANAAFFNVNSTGIQHSGSWVYKIQWTRVLTNRATLDTSMNSNGFHFPTRSRVNETPVRDLTTNLVRGGFSGEGVGLTAATPSRQQARRFHWNANLSLFKDNFLGGNHDIRTGWGAIWEDQRQTFKGVTGSPGTPGHIVLYYSNGVPDRFQVQNTPFLRQNSMLQNFIFFQDKWQIGKKLTVNAGLRFDRYAEFYPEQGNDGVGPFATRLEVARRNVATFNNVVPRLGLSYDIFGTTRTALKVGYARYADNVSYDISAAANPNTNPITDRYAWDGTLPITKELIARSRLLQTSGQTIPTAVNPDLTNSYTDEYMVGIEHELFEDLGVNVNFIRKIRGNAYGSVNRAEPYGGFAPVAALDPGPDGRANTGDDKPFVIFERLVNPGSDLYLSNFDAGSNFTALEVGAQKRFSRNWQMVTGFDWTKRNLQANISNDPNTILYGSDSGEHDSQWTYKLSGTYTLPKGFGMSGTYNAQKGEPYGRRVQFAPALLTNHPAALRQGTPTVFVEPEGSYFYPTVNLVNLRLEKTFKFHERGKVTGMFDLFNTFNSNTVVGVDTLSGTVVDSNNATVQRFGRATQIVNPRIFRLGVRWAF